MKVTGLMALCPRKESMLVANTTVSGDTAVIGWLKTSIGREIGLYKSDNAAILQRVSSRDVRETFALFNWASRGAGTNNSRWS